MHLYRAVGGCFVDDGFRLYNYRLSVGLSDKAVDFGVAGLAVDDYAAAILAGVVALLDAALPSPHYGLNGIYYFDAVAPCELVGGRRLAVGLQQHTCNAPLAQLLVGYRH